MIGAPPAKAGWLAVAVATAAAYAPLFPWLLQRWRAPDGFFSHGPLIPLACAWIVWRRRARIAAAAGAGEWRALAAVVPALAGLVAATALRFDSPALASLLLLLPGLVWLLGGPALLRQLAFPLAFLAFAVPWPMELLVDVVQGLKLSVVAASAALVNLLGAGVTASGSFLLLPGGDRLLVDDECSGLKSALALVALGTFMAGTAQGIGRGGRLLFAALALPVALAANVLRVALLAGVGRLGGAGRASDWHGPSTWGVYAVVVVAYLLLERRLRRGTAREAVA